VHLWLPGPQGAPVPMAVTPVPVPLADRGLRAVS
jgi:hypothetical protein